jgi:hypothetical protein
MVSGQLCFLCANEITATPALCWAGSLGLVGGDGGSELWLHVDCFPKLVQKMYRDYDEIKYGAMSVGQRLLESVFNSGEPDAR